VAVARRRGIAVGINTLAVRFSLAGECGLSLENFVCNHARY
jgi:hypothetical protein